MQVRQVYAQRAHALAVGGLQLKMLEHEPARFPVCPVAHWLRHADGLRAPELGESGRFGGKHFRPAGRVELHEIGALPAADDVALVDAAAPDSGAGFDGKRRDCGLADRALDVRPGIHGLKTGMEPQINADTHG
ncbi:hypothetical protein D3C83_06370 [compost metagenome]